MLNYKLTYLKKIFFKSPFVLFFLTIYCLLFNKYPTAYFIFTYLKLFNLKLKGFFVTSLYF